MLKKMKDEIELLSRHVIVIRAVMEHQPIGIMKLSELLDLPFHRIRYSLRVLEQLGTSGPHLPAQWQLPRQKISCATWMITLMILSGFWNP